MTLHLTNRIPRRLLLAAFAISFLSLGNTSLAAEPQPNQTKAKAAKDKRLAKTPKLTITLDTSQSPEMADWAAEAKARCEKFYPTIISQLGSPHGQQPISVRITFRPGPGVAATGGRHIVCSAGWFTAHPDDYGAVIHELCHVVQAYGHQRAPGWVTEGIADYVRWFKFEPPPRRPRPDPTRSRYTDGYQTTAAFFDWIVRTRDKTFVRRLNADIRSGKYSDDLFRQYAGKPVDELWDEYKESL